MPARSQAKQIAAAIALNAPEKLYARNRGLRAMNLSDLAHYASTPRKGLPAHVKKKPKKRTGR
mgnify:CR=1 FL=1